MFLFNSFIFAWHLGIIATCDKRPFVKVPPGSLSTLEIRQSFCCRFGPGDWAAGGNDQGFHEDCQGCRCTLCLFYPQPIGSCGFCSCDSCGTQVLPYSQIVKSMSRVMISQTRNGQVFWRILRDFVVSLPWTLSTPRYFSPWTSSRHCWLPRSLWSIHEATESQVVAPCCS